MNKGFTLVELLGVIVLLSVLATITLFAVGGTIKKSKNTLSDVQIDNIIQAAKTYHLKEGMSEEDIEEDSTEICVEVNYLVNAGYIDNQEVIDLSSDKKLNASVVIKYTNNKYKYKYKEENCSKTTN